MTVGFTWNDNMRREEMKNEQVECIELLLTVGKYVGVIVEGELDTDGTFDMVGIIVFCLMYDVYE